MIGARDPYWGVLTHDRFRSVNLTPAAIEEFYESGRTEIQRTVDVLHQLGGEPFAPDVAVDFGCGVGRLSFAMTQYARRVLGVDVADSMLDVARRQASERGIANLELQVALPSTGADWVNSVIAFQHIPPDRGQLLFDALIDLLNPGGYVSLHLTFFRDRRHTGDVQRDLGEYRYDGNVVELLSAASDAAGCIAMYDYDLNRAFRALFMSGVESVRVDHTDHGGCHGVMLYGRRRFHDSGTAVDPTVPAEASHRSGRTLSRLRRRVRRSWGD